MRLTPRCHREQARQRHQFIDAIEHPPRVTWGRVSGPRIVAGIVAKRFAGHGRALIAHIKLQRSLRHNGDIAAALPKEALETTDAEAILAAYRRFVLAQ